MNVVYKELNKIMRQRRQKEQMWQWKQSQNVKSKYNSKYMSYKILPLVDQGKLQLSRKQTNFN